MLSGTAKKILLSVEIEHTYIGDLQVEFLLVDTPATGWVGDSMMTVVKCGS